MVVPAVVVICMNMISLAANYSSGISQNAAGALFYHFIPDFILKSSNVIFFLEFPNSLYIIVGITVISVLITLFITEPESQKTLLKFYHRVKPAGPGWKKIGGVVIPGMGKMFLGWISGTAIVYSILFLIGSVLFKRYHDAGMYGGLFMVSLLFFLYALKENPADE
jgi:hypothetical protein